LGLNKAFTRIHNYWYTRVTQVRTGVQILS